MEQFSKNSEYRPVPAKVAAAKEKLLGGWLPESIWGNGPQPRRRKPTSKPATTQIVKPTTKLAIVKVFESQVNMLEIALGVLRSNAGRAEAPAGDLITLLEVADRCTVVATELRSIVDEQQD